MPEEQHERIGHNTMIFRLIVILSLPVVYIAVLLASLLALYEYIVPVMPPWLKWMFVCQSAPCGANLGAVLTLIAVTGLILIVAPFVSWPEVNE